MTSQRLSFVCKNPETTFCIVITTTKEKVMIVKEPILKHRVRKVPKSFSWIDHRLVRDNHSATCSHAEAALYLFLVCVADEKGLSYYGDKSIMEKISMDQQTLEKARSGLIRNSLIAWRHPIYQVLCLQPVSTIRSSGPAMSLGDILKAAMGGVQ
jgi:hypothetical protein